MMFGISETLGATGVQSRREKHFSDAAEHVACIERCARSNVVTSRFKITLWLLNSL